jgi:K+-sensing histidine kinase KdpD
MMKSFPAVAAASRGYVPGRSSVDHRLGPGQKESSLLSKAKQLTLKTELARDMPIGSGDERRIAQVLLNLIGNAIKFTDFGEVAVSASAANGSFIVAIRDTGPASVSQTRQRYSTNFNRRIAHRSERKAGPALICRSASESSKCTVEEYGSS